MIGSEGVQLVLVTTPQSSKVAKNGVLRHHHAHRQRECGSSSSLTACHLLDDARHAVRWTAGVRARRVLHLLYRMGLARRHRVYE